MVNKESNKKIDIIVNKIMIKEGINKRFRKNINAWNTPFKEFHKNKLRKEIFELLETGLISFKDIEKEVSSFNKRG
jgi:hypothetical protein